MPLAGHFASSNPARQHVAMSHFRPIRLALPAGSCSFRPESGSGDRKRVELGRSPV